MMPARAGVNVRASLPEDSNRMSQGSASSPVWVLADDRPGNVAQCLGVAEALGVGHEVKPLRYTRLAGLPNALRGTSLLGIAAESRKGLAPPWPRLAVAAGRRTAPVMRWLGRRGVATVQIMDPGWPGRGDFDLVVVPRHDGPMAARPNLLRITGAPHRVTPARLAEAAEAWRPRLAHLPRPWIAVIVGGATRRRPFTADMARTLATGAAAMARAAGGSLLVTTSRRTGPQATAALLAALPEPRFVHQWGDGGENPYMGLLALADAIVVTGDSVSMCCEACATTAPVNIFAPPGSVADKHARLHRELYELGLARPLDDGCLEAWTHPPLRPAEAVAEEIRRRGLLPV